MYDATQSAADVAATTKAINMVQGYETLTVYSAVAAKLTGPSNTVGWTIAAGGSFTVNVKGIAAGTGVFTLTADDGNLGRVEITFEYETGTAGV